MDDDIQDFFTSMKATIDQVIMTFREQLTMVQQMKDDAITQGFSPETAEIMARDFFHMMTHAASAGGGQQ